MPTFFETTVSSFLIQANWSLRDGNLLSVVDGKWERYPGEYALLTQNTFYISTTVDYLKGWTNFSFDTRFQLDNDLELIRYADTEEFLVAIAAYIY